MKSDNRESYIDKITKAVTEMAKGMKAVSFYPESHPSLIKILQKICQLIDDVPPPKGGSKFPLANRALPSVKQNFPKSMMPSRIFEMHSSFAEPTNSSSYPV